MASSTKPEVHKLYRNATKGGTTKPHPYSIMRKHLMKFRCMVFEICERTDRQTHIPITKLCTSPGGKIITDKCMMCARLALYPVYSAENVGFRCVEPVSSPSSKSRNEYSSVRTPTRHRLTETWSYKVKRAFTAIIGGNRPAAIRNEEL